MFQSPKVAKAFTLTEMVVVIAIIGIAAVGALDYQYYSAKHNRIARTQMTAAKTAQLLIEDWKSFGGLEEYEPADLDLGFVAASTPDGYSTDGVGDHILNGTVYTITVDNVPMVILLAYTDVDTDATSGTTLRQLTVMVRWRLGQSVGSGGQSFCENPVVLTTYVRLDE